MKRKDYEKIIERYKTSLFVVIIILTIFLVYNKLVLNNEFVSFLIYGGLVGYSVAIIVCVILLKKIVSVKKKD